MLQQRLISKITTASKGITLLVLLLCLSQSIAFAQVKRINLKDSEKSSGAKVYNLYQSYKVSKGKIKTYYYGFSEYKGKQWFGKNASFFAVPSNSFPFKKFTTSLDNSTILAESGDKLHVYDTTLEKVISSFVVKGLNRNKLNNDGSLAYVEVNDNGNNSMKIFDTNTGEVVKEIPSVSGNFRLSPNDRYLAINRGESFLVYDLWEDSEAMVYNNESIKKRKQNTSEFILDIEVTSSGLVAMSYVLKGEIKKKHVRIQHFAVVDSKTGRKLCNVRCDGARKSFYSLDPTGKVLFANGKFYDVKSGNEIEVNHSSKKEEFHKIESWKFHPHIPNVYHAKNGEGVTGMYSFE